jgi:hypothetical protein
MIDQQSDTQYELTEKALALASIIMNTKGVQNMASNPIMSSVFSSNPKRNQNQQGKETDISKEQRIAKTPNKDPNYTKIPANIIRPLKLNDSIADILAKMYNFMLKKYTDDDKAYKKEKKYRKKLVAIKEKRIEELINLFGGKYTKKILKDKDESFFSKLLRYAVVGGALLIASKAALASVEKKVKDALPKIPDFMSFLGIGNKTASRGPAKSLSELIARGESGGSYDIYNTGKAGVTGPPLKLSEMTVGEVMNLQKQGKVFAAGKYQMIPGTLESGVKTLNISKSEKFSPELQERMFSDYLIGSKHPEIQKYLNDPNPNEKTKHDFLKALSKEFAAVEDPDKPGKSYYEGKAGNRASIKTSEVLAAAESDRLTRQSDLAKKQNPVPEASVTVEPAPPTNIPQRIPQTPINRGDKKVSMLNNNTNIINGGTTYNIAEETRMHYPPLIDKQYYNYG